MRISSAVCTYRQTDLLPGAIESLLGQSLESECYEIIVVDNNSRDGTAGVVAQYQEKVRSTEIRYILETRQGLSYARNTAVGLAKADIVAFLDDDAEADHNWLETLLDVFDHDPDAWIVGGKVRPIWDGERPEWLKDDMLRSLSIVEWGDVMRPLVWPERVIGTNMSFKKQVFSEEGLFATDLGRRGSLLLGNEDTEIQERVHERGKKVIYTPYAVVHHHVPRERMTWRYFWTRGYGNARSAVILAGRQEGPTAMRKILGRALRKLSWALVVTVRRLIGRLVGRGSYLFGTSMEVAHLSGVVVQCVLELLRGDERTL